VTTIAVFLQLRMSRKSQKPSMLWELLLHAPFVWNVTNCQQMPRPAFHLFFLAYKHVGHDRTGPHVFLETRKIVFKLLLL